MFYRIRGKRILIVILLVLITLNIIQFIENRNYEEYLSQKVKNSVSLFSSSILENNILLEEAINNQEITNRKLNRLGINFLSIANIHRELIEIYDIKSERKNISPTTIEIADDCSMFISMKMLGNYGNQYKIIEDEYIIELSSEYLESLKIMQKVVNEWFNIINDNVVGATSDGMKSVYWEKYDNAINNHYWIDILDELAGYNSELSWNRNDFKY